MSVPELFVGAWHRVDISIDGGEPTETHTVWWLQAATAFADIRVPLHGTSDADSFAGHTRWEDPSLTWDRHLDLHARPDTDTGVIAWDRLDMLEDGTFGFGGQTPMPYRERWRRLPELHGSGYVVLTNDTSRLVCIGNYAITIVDDRSTAGSYRATAWHRPSVLWEEAMVWPFDHDGVSAPPDDSDGWEVGSTVRLDDATTWTVEEIAA